MLYCDKCVPVRVHSMHPACDRADTSTTENIVGSFYYYTHHNDTVHKNTHHSCHCIPICAYACVAFPETFLGKPVSRAENGCTRATDSRLTNAFTSSNRTMRFTTPSVTHEFEINHTVKTYAEHPLQQSFCNKTFLYLTKSAVTLMQL